MCCIGRKADTSIADRFDNKFCQRLLYGLPARLQIKARLVMLHNKHNVYKKNTRSRQMSIIIFFSNLFYHTGSG